MTEPSENNFLRYVTRFLVAVLKQVPGVGAVVSIADECLQEGQESAQDQVLQVLEKKWDMWSRSWEERLDMLLNASKCSPQDAMALVPKEIAGLRAEGSVISAEKEEAIADLVAAMPSIIKAKIEAPLQQGKQRNTAANRILPLDRYSTTADRLEFYQSLLPCRRPTYSAKSLVPNKPAWQFDCLLGMGGFGEIWRIEHRLLGYQALKLCLEEQSGVFLRKELSTIATLCRQLANHRNIVTVLDANMDITPYWIAFEYVPGGTLEGYIRAFGGPLPIQEALGMFSEICRGMRDAHSLGIVHRDIKPANILISKDGAPKIGDFGLGKVMADQSQKQSTKAKATMTLRGYGTRGYMSPEQQEGEPADPSDDIYSLGVVLYQMMMGSVTRDPRYARTNLAKFNPKLPNEVQELILDCLEKPRLKEDISSEEARPKDAGVLLDRLERLSCVKLKKTTRAGFLGKWFGKKDGYDDGEVSAAQGEIADAEEAIQRLKQEKLALEQELSRLNDLRHTEEPRLQQLQTQVRDLQQKEQQLQTQIAKDLATQEAEYKKTTELSQKETAKLQQLQDDMRVLEIQKQDAQAAVQKAQQEQTSVQAAVQKAQQEYIGVQYTLQKTQQEYLSVQATLQKAQQEYIAVQTLLQKAQQEQIAVQSTLQTTQQISSMQAVLQKIQEEYNAVQAALQKAQQEQITIQATLQKAQQEQIAAQATLQKTQQEQITVQAALQKAQQEQITIQATLQKTQQEQIAAQAALQKTQQEQITAQAALQIAKDAKQRLEAEVKELDNKVEEMRKFLQDLMEQKKRAQEELELAKKDLESSRPSQPKPKTAAPISIPIPPAKPAPIAKAPTGTKFQTRSNFSSDAEYGAYVKATLKPRMRVRAIEDYEKVKKGMLGTYYGTNDGNPPCFVVWDQDLKADVIFLDAAPENQKSHAYWVPWDHIAIIEDAPITFAPATPTTSSTSSPKGMKKRMDFSSESDYGDYVKSVLKPKMRVRALEDYEKVKKGMTGTYYGTNAGNPPCFVIWDVDLGTNVTWLDGAPENRKSYAYWVYWKHLEIIEVPAELEISDSVSSSKGTTKPRSTFASDAAYGDYIKSLLQPKMRVRAIQDSGSKVTKGMTGTYYGTNTGNPPCFVVWDQDLGTDVVWIDIAPADQKSHGYWVHWYDLEIIADAASLASQIESMILPSDSKPTTPPKKEGGGSLEDQLQDFFKKPPNPPKPE